MFLKESCFPYCWKVLTVVPVFKNVGERSMTKNYRPVTLLSVVNKVFEKPVNSMLFHHLEICGLLSDLQHGFRYYQLTVVFLTVVFDRIASALNRSGLLIGQAFALVLYFLSNKLLRVVLDGKSSQ